VHDPGKLLLVRIDYMSSCWNIRREGTMTFGLMSCKEKEIENSDTKVVKALVLMFSNKINMTYSSRTCSNHLFLILFSKLI